MGGADGLGDDVDNIEKDANVRNDAQWDEREHAVHLERIESCAYHTELDATYAREYVAAWRRGFQEGWRQGTQAGEALARRECERGCRERADRSG
ncbi:hypothetical protein CDCA_CDCA17G4449 [Cyanidium caldarium]|uniref:Essential protein Yae1 N-terminal domain-containing protein n=1 Tax=Cyanidium caldarium TaxID=2771 RepID=A0AAV9J1Q2_CYACA|nr:hypothetical protein CDCA_CDCA17G4449 [Cyanidium caldarium]